MILNGNTVLVTGGATGIGLAFARRLSELGNTVIICGRSKEKLQAAKTTLPDIHTIECDITDADDLARLQAELAAGFPKLNFLINNAGIQLPLDFANRAVDETKITKEINTNLTSHIVLTSRLLPVLSSQSSSAVIFISSALARVPKKSAPVYCATKAAIHSFAQSLRMQLAHSNTKVFEVVPDLVETAMTADRPNAKKITPDALALSALKGLAKDSGEIRVGRTGLLLAIHRLMPSLAMRIINK